MSANDRSGRTRHSPAAERNRQPILEVLKPLLPAHGLVLEIASGTGQHVVHFAAALPALEWQPSDPDPKNRDSIDASVAAAGLANVRPAMDLDVLDDWPDLRADAVIVANLLHISAVATTRALCRGAAGLLNAGGLLHVYGPFNRNGAFTSESNARFDADLKARNALWGIRDLESLIGAAEAEGFAVLQLLDMPVNNYSIAFRKEAV